jgi:tRNA(fMet)-specific endonuclease VapC
MGMIVDSNVFIEAERRHGAVDLDPWKNRGPVLLSVVTVSELLVGVHRANTPERKTRRAAFVDAILTTIPISM